MTFVKGQSGNPKGMTKGALEKIAARSIEKQAKIVDCLSRGMTLKEIAKECGYASPQSVWNAIKRVEAKAPELLNLMNLPLPRALRKLGEQLEAKETKFFTHKGEIVSQVDVEAHDVQQNAAIQLARLHNAYPTREQENSGVQVLTQIKVVIEDVSREGERTLTAQATGA